ncbi:hypothetical protein NP493_710g01052 [Ridgeia piscesae]|uniref:Uncharacterized protein n=1 Tax=Ridgeia piscesae TaxID=27915 RepID=A0AAD9KS45_RIDPI|nr:hypothetical protein NP493_710g01052 [Ridgeia piscesae]
MTMNDYCSNYRKVKRCRSSFADNCTDIVKKEYAGVDEKMTLICKNNGAEYAKHIDCMQSIKRKRAELGCYRAYKSGEAHLFEMTTNSWSEWRDKYCQ